MARTQRLPGGVKPYPPLSTRTEERPNPKPTKYYPYTVLDPHERDNWHKVRPTSIPNIAWGIYRIRRARVGQLSLFGRKHKCRCTANQRGVPIRKERKRIPVFIVELIKSGDGVVEKMEFPTVASAYLWVFGTFKFTAGEVAQFKDRGSAELSLTEDGYDLVGIRREDRKRKGLCKAH